MSIADISGFIPQTDADSITSTEWNTFVGGIYDYINGTLLPALNLLNAKGKLLAHDGSNIVAVSNAGASDNGKVLTFDSTQTPGMKWASVANVATLTTKGDLLGYSSANARVPIGTDGQVLTARSSDSLGLAWENVTTVPSGLITMWSGSIASIPAGWVLCDGNNSTPNLQGLFVVGAGNSGAPASGGMGLMAPGGPYGDVSAGAGLGPSHTHTIAQGQFAGPFGGGTVTLGGVTSSATVTPRYYALAYIMKT